MRCSIIVTEDTSSVLCIPSEHARVHNMSVMYQHDRATSLFALWTIQNNLSPWEAIRYPLICFCAVILRFPSRGDFLLAYIWAEALRVIHWKENFPCREEINYSFSGMEGWASPWQLQNSSEIKDKYGCVCLMYILFHQASQRLFVSLHWQHRNKQRLMYYANNNYLKTSWAAHGI